MPQADYAMEGDRYKVGENKGNTVQAELCYIRSINATYYRFLVHRILEVRIEAYVVRHIACANGCTLSDQ